MTNGEYKTWVVGLVLIFGTACCKVALDDSEVEHLASFETASIFSEVERVVKFLPGGIHVNVKHGDIDGLMPAMETSFPLNNQRL